VGKGIGNQRKAVPKQTSLGNIDIQGDRRSFPSHKVQVSEVHLCVKIAVGITEQGVEAVI
jgi:hypothetical protein